MLTVNEAAEKLGVRPALVYRLCAARKIRHCRVGVGRGVLRIPPEALDDYLAGATVDAGAEAPRPAVVAPRKLTSQFFRL